jgi:hypothetical protein
MPPAVQYLGQTLKGAPANSSVIFLGDNIYPDGMAPKPMKEERALDEHRLKVQVDILKEFKGRPFFVPGNHDWYTHGLKGVKRQRKFIEEHLGRNDVFFPEPGCGGPVEVKLNDDLVLILVDSQWWLGDWAGEPEINDGCEAKSRQDFKLLFEEAIKGNRSGNVVIAMHHPLYTHGPHGGQSTVRDHLFPLTNISDNLWIPLPGIGTLYAFFRATIGSRQDLAHPNYKELKNSMISSARKNGNFIFVAGHEHNLQYIEKDDQSFIVSGSGSKKSASKIGDGVQFAYGHAGFSRIDFFEDGSVWVHFYEVDTNGIEGREIFRKKINGPIEKKQISLPDSFPEFEKRNEITVKPLSEEDVSRKRSGSLLWGNLYRETYAESVKVPVLDLEELYNGVIPVKRGGGYQTNSLRLEEKGGKQFTLRSLTKDATRTVPPFKRTACTSNGQKCRNFSYQS